MSISLPGPTLERVLVVGGRHFGPGVTLATAPPSVQKVSQNDSFCSLAATRRTGRPRAADHRRRLPCRTPSFQPAQPAMTATATSSMMRTTAKKAAASQPTRPIPTMATTAITARFPGRPPRRRSGSRPERAVGTAEGSRTRQIWQVSRDRPWGQGPELTPHVGATIGPLSPSQTFPIRYGLFRPLLSALGVGPRFSGVDIDPDRVRVRMGWSFRAAVARRSIAGVRRHPGAVWSIGVHGWNGQWLVNGGARGLVSVSIAPPARAWVLGVPVRLRTLIVSVESPDELIAALTDGGVDDHGQHD